MTDVLLVISIIYHANVVALLCIENKNKKQKHAANLIYE